MIVNIHRFIVFGILLALLQTAHSQSIAKGDLLIDAFYGCPNFSTTQYRPFQFGVQTTRSGIGPVGVRMEYLLLDRLGLGIEASYRTAQLMNVYKSYDENGNPYMSTDHFRNDHFGVLLLFSYHFIVQEKVDMYGIIGAGYGRSKTTFSTDNPNAYPAPNNDDLPIDGRIGIGARYFILPAVALNLGIGVSSSGVINGGVTVRL